MAPKKRKIEGSSQDIRIYYPKKDMSQVRVKEEEAAGASAGGHSHLFKVKFGSDKHEYTIDCNQPRMLLEAIKLHLADEFAKNIKCPDQRIVIKRGEGDNSCLVATHFPCSCLDNGELLTISMSRKVVEAPNQKQYDVQEKEKYSVFFIDKEGGEDSKSKVKQIFRCTDIAQKFKYFCVYGLKDMTVEEVLKQDGRFVDNLSGFTLSNNRKDNVNTKYSEMVRSLHKGRYKICLPKQRQSEAKDARQQTSNQQLKKQEDQHESNDSQNGAVQDIQCRSEIRAVLELAHEEGVSLKAAIEKKDCSIDLSEIQDLLRQQFPKLKEQMETRFPGQAFKKALNLQKENFGKIEEAFAEIYRMREVCDLSRSVCLLVISDITSSRSIQGTGFVLFDNFILTNAHLFDPWSKEGIEGWWEHIRITAEFNFEKLNTEPRTKIEAKPCVGDVDLDFAVLELIPENQTTDQTAEPEKAQVPPGLLKKFGPLPWDGHACLVGHPAGGVKKRDLTCIIKKDDRDQAVDQNLEGHIDFFTIYAIIQQIKSDPKANICVTYNTFMYHGSSGSPVFDAHGQVFGMHSGGFYFGFPKANDSVIEFAFPLLTIFEKFVSVLKERGNEALLSRVQEEAKGNRYLEKIMERVVGPRENRHEV